MAVFYVLIIEVTKMVDNVIDRLFPIRSPCTVPPGPVIAESPAQVDQAHQTLLGPRSLFSTDPIPEITCNGFCYECYTIDFDTPFWDGQTVSIEPVGPSHSLSWVSFSGMSRQNTAQSVSDLSLTFWVNHSSRPDRI